MAEDFVVEMLHITKEFPGIKANDDITLQLRKGEVHALLGENGAGKSTLMSVLFGLYQPEAGQIRKNGKEVVIRNPNDANALGIGMVHQHFKLVECFSVLDNIILATIALMLLENVIGIKMYLTACLGAVLLVLTGVLSEKEALASIHQPTIFLFAGVLALSDAIQKTGAGDVVADWMIKILGGTTNTYLIMAVFFLVPFVLTQVMSNLATLTIFIPLVTSACLKMGLDPRAAVVGVITASCISIMTPMAAPCQIMIIEPGGYKLKDYLKCGTPLAALLCMMSILVLPMMFPLYYLQ